MTIGSAPHGYWPVASRAKGLIVLLPLKVIKCKLKKYLCGNKTRENRQTSLLQDYF